MDPTVSVDLRLGRSEGELYVAGYLQGGDGVVDSLLPELGVAVDKLRQGGHHLWIELGPRLSLDFGERLLHGSALPVDPVRGHGIERIGDEKHAGADGNLLAGKSVGVP